MTAVGSQYGAAAGALLLMSVCGARPLVQSVQAGKDFTLSIGDEAVSGDTPPWVVRFVRVAFDGRCPRSVECAASLPVTVEVLLGARGHEAASQLSIFDRDVGEPRIGGVRSCARLGSLVLRLRDVQPWPATRGGVAAGQYRATFVLANACDQADGGTK